MTVDRVAAFSRERSAVLSFCSGLSEAQWHADSAAAGWRVRDVVAHLGASCKTLFTPAAITVLTTRDIERANDRPVDSRRDWSVHRVLAEYDRWSAWTLRAAAIIAATPPRALRTRLGELGSFRMDLVLPGALVFDHHVHLRHDIAPAVGLTAPTTDAQRMTVVVEWMLAVLANQLKATPPSWLSGPITLELHGAGGGRWQIDPNGSLTVHDGTCRDEAGAIRSDVNTFPSWATTRTDWHSAGLELTGDLEQVTRLLGSINIV
ncbi:maleylpyruvate isomerase N-terminal domain-containing protein [Mycobacterium sp. SVM_VP21]|nr:maleylpyruvate isomerase N-terminal domain-containing protein [Mycobacterium sp. SVM_VP21]